ncbi:MAG: TlpA disulfide reductase family protein [Pirellulales bacterium]
MRNVTRVASLLAVFGLLGGHTRNISAAEVPCGAEPTKVGSKATQPAIVLPDDIRQLLEHVKGVHGHPTSGPRPPSARGRTYRSVEAALEKIHDIASEEDKQLPGYQEAMDLRLVFRTALFSEGPGRGTPKQRAELIEAIQSRLQSCPIPSKDVLAAAAKVASALEAGAEPQRAVEFYRQVGRILVEKPDERVAAKGAQMLGAARRLELVGKPLELAGTPIDGSRFDWADYRGKVVLVEVWATWCTPCIREFVNVERRRNEYRQRGFEVIGISVDENREALDDFLEKSPLPWPTLYDGGPDANPFVPRYGIAGASAAILVGRDGNVVSIHAFGRELDRLLAELLGANSAVEQQEK